MNQVEGRRARFSIGAAKCQLYDPEDEEQAGRTPKVFADGQLYITHYWTPIITTVRQMVILLCLYLYCLIKWFFDDYAWHTESASQRN